jgi:hypothetical protein
MRNPGGHNARWWRKHPEAVRPGIKERQDHVPLEAVRKTLPRKLWDFAESPILWGGLGVLIGAVTSLISLKYLFVMSAMVVCVAVLKANFAASHRLTLQVGGNLALCCVVVLVFSIIWKYVPKPVVPPTLDQQGDVLVDRFSRKFPWLVSPPRPSPGPGKPAEHAHITYDPPTEAETPLLPYRVGQTPSLTIGFRNTGDFQVLNPGMAGTVQVEDNPQGPANAKQIDGIFLRARKQKNLQHFHNIGAVLDPYLSGRGHDAYPFRADAPLTEDDVLALGNGHKILCAMAVTDWQDSSGEYETDFGRCYLCVSPFVPCSWRLLPQDGLETKLH